MAAALALSACADGSGGAVEPPVDDAGAPCAVDAGPGDDAGPEVLPEADAGPDVPDADVGTPVTVPAEGAYCSGLDSWTFGPGAAVASVLDGVRLYGSLYYGPGALHAEWATRCIGGRCVPQVDASDHALVVGDGWVEVDGARFAGEECPQ